MRALLLLPFLAACGDNQSVDTATCSSGLLWTGGDDEENAGPEMNPGQDCIACHASDEGPHYTVAGTVMGAYGDPDDCLGVEGVTVAITDADGVVTELTSNASGNFYTQADIATPYTVELTFEGRTLAMSAAQSDGACASCHTAEGANSAPGRVVAP